MRTSDTYHIPALLNETVDALNVRPTKYYIDATLGGGGHSEEILKRGGNLLGIDLDPDAITEAGERLKKYLACPGLTPPKFAKGNFANIGEIAKKEGFDEVDGIILDLGVSSHQLETPERGFSFNQDALLDMRMSPDLAVTAKDLVNGLTEFELSELFSKLGEEEQAKKYAKVICKARELKPIEKTLELAQIIKSASLKRGFDRIHPATKVFQALRIAVNDELNNLREVLPKATDLLNKNGRIAIISFHSLEDGIVKRFFIEKEKQGVLKIINEKPITPTEEETNLNPRSRSARLRIAEKL